jgi:hypothetical protein
MKKPAKKKLALDRDTIRALDAELERVIGGLPPCTEYNTGCGGNPVHTFRYYC